MQILKFLALIIISYFCSTEIILAQTSAPKSILFEKTSYTTHPLIKFRTIRNRDLPLSLSLDKYAPFPIKVDQEESKNAFLFGYYAQSIQEAFKNGILDRAIVNDSLAPKVLASFEMPDKGYRLFTSRNKRYDKIKRIRYAIKKGVPVLVGLKTSPPESIYPGQSHWNGEGPSETSTLVITGYDSKTASFQLMNTKGNDWGEQGFIWMTYLDLLSTAKEVVCLKNPTLVKTSDRKFKPLNLEVAFTAAQLRQAEERDPQLEELAARYNEKTGYYQFPDLDAQADRDRFQLKIKIPKGRCAYLFTAHPDGRTTPAWSMNYHHQDTTVTLPPVSFYQFPESGNEYFIFLISHQPIPRWRRYIDYFQYNDSDVSVRDKLNKAFKRYLLPESAINYAFNQGQAAAFVQPDDKYVLPLIIEWKIK